MTLHQVVWSRTSRSRVIIILRQGQQLPVHSNDIAGKGNGIFILRHLLNVGCSVCTVYCDRLRDQLTFIYSIDKEHTLYYMFYQFGREKTGHVFTYFVHIYIYMHTIT